MAEQHSTVASLVSEAMDKKGLTIKDLAEKLDITAEHTRRIVRGLYTPNKVALKGICLVLDLPFDETYRIALSERIRKKYGVVADNLEVRPKGLEPIEKSWEFLTKAQQKDVVSMVTSWAANNKKVLHTTK